VTDPRWALAGPPPRSNSETAWLQHVITHLTAEGRGYVLTSTASTASATVATARRSLLRAGCNEAVVALPPKMLQHTAIQTAVWVLRSPQPSRSSGSVLMVDASTSEPRGDLPIEDWVTYSDGEGMELGMERVSRASVAINDLISDDVASLDPRRWVETYSDPIEIAERYRQAHTTFDRAAELLRASRLEPVDRVWPPSHVVTVRQLDTQGALRILTKGRVIAAKDSREDEQTDPRVVTTRMVRDGLPPLPLNSAPADRDAETTAPGDVLVTTMRTIRAVVDETGGRVLRPGVIRVWVDPTQFDPRYIAACFSASWNQRFEHGSFIPHASIKYLEIPLIPLPAQREVADDVQRLWELSDSVARLSDASREIADVLLASIRFNIELPEIG
jgi:hypothetical protein